MLCQNCLENEATTHIKRISGGEAAELHLCRTCAEHLGYAFVPGFGFNIYTVPTDFFPELSYTLSSPQTERCSCCGASFEEIVRTGMMGCPSCYETFYQKLRPSLSRLHGRAQHSGKIGAACRERPEDELPLQRQELEREMKQAAEARDFELAAKLRDRLNALGGEELE